jgi:RimJ/RimL family protein N-acetyltransferase
MQVRELEERDFTSLCELILQVYDEMPYATTFGKRPSDEELEELMRRKLEGMRDRTRIDFVATLNDRVVADCEITKTTDAGGLIGIIVAKEQRRRGIGKRLVEKCAAKARLQKMLEVYAEIDDRNEGAARFFSRCGFREQEGEDKLVMVRNL